MKVLLTLAFLAALAAPAQAEETAYIQHMNDSIHRVTVWETCEKVARPIKYGLQIADVFVSQATLNMHPYSKESDSFAHLFMGRSHSVTGLLLSQIVVDVVADALTRKNPALRCGSELRQIDANLYGIAIQHSSFH